MEKKLAARNILALMILVVFTLGWVGQTRGAEDPIRIGWLPATSFGMMTGMILKTYEQEGLKPEHIKFEAGPPMFSAFATGDIDVAYGSISPAIFGLAQGLDLKYFLVAEDASPANGLVVRRESGIKSLADQKGKNIAVTFGAGPHFGLLRSLKRTGLAERDLTILDMVPSVIQAAFIRGNIDGAWLWEPWLVKMEKEKGVIVANFRDVDMPVATVWVARSAFLRDRPQTVQKFIKAWERTINLKLTPDLAGRIGNFLGLTGEMATTAIGRYETLRMDQQLEGNPNSMGTSETKGQAPLYKQLREFSEFYYQQKKIKQIPDLLGAIDPRPVEQYLKKK